MISSGLLSHLGLAKTPELSALRSVPAERLPRWAMAKRLLPSLDLTALRLEKRAVRLCEAAAQIHFSTIPECRQAIAAHGWEAVQLAAALCAQQETVQHVAASGDCVTLAQLAVKGSDLPWLQGPAVSAALQQLLDHVLEHPEDNQKELLLSLLKQ